MRDTVVSVEDKISLCIKHQNVVLILNFGKNDTRPLKMYMFDK